jgi:hypothetical protein
VIEHRPFGIDDPYKRLASERSPRDPVALDALQIGFRTATAAAEAWVVLERDGAQQRHPAQAVDACTWLAQLGPLEAGTHSYTIHARADGREHASERFALDVARERRVEQALRGRADSHGLTVSLSGRDGARAELRLGASAPGVARLELTPTAGGGDSPTAAGGDTATTEAPARRLPCTVSADDDGWTLRAEGLEVRLDAATLRLSVTRPGRAGALVRTSVAARWWELPDGRVLRHQLSLLTDPLEPLYGLGERFVGPDLRGRCWDVRVYEEYKEQGERTYLPIPFFLSPRGWGVWLETDTPAKIDARNARTTGMAGPDGDASGAAVTIDVDAVGREGEALVAHLIVADAPYDVTAAFVGLTGDIALPPKWAYGPWMSANTWNDQASALEAVRRTSRRTCPPRSWCSRPGATSPLSISSTTPIMEPVPGGERMRWGFPLRRPLARSQRAHR